MAAPTYSSDLADINLATGSWVEPTGATAGGVPGADTDYYIEGTACISKSMAATGLAGMVWDRGSGLTVASGDAVWFWGFEGTPNTIGTYAQGGFRGIIGSAQGAYKMWTLFGSEEYTYGGWLCTPVDPTLTADFTYGSPDGTLRWFGAVVNQPTNSPAKGNPFGLDAIRHGRDFIIINGDSGTPATFVDAAAWNDNINRRWGLFQAVSGGYLMQGRFIIGDTSAAYFVDSNRVINIANTRKVSAAFNSIVFRHASTYVNWDSIVISALGTVSPGTFIVEANADINIANSSFTSLGAFTLMSATDMLDCVFRGCGKITAAGANLSGSQIYKSASTPALLWDVATDTANKLDGCVFTSAGTGYAIELGTNCPSEINLTDAQFSGYGSTGTANAAIYNNSGKSVTINILGTGSSPTYNNGSGASTTIVAGQKTLTLTGLVSGSEVRIYSHGTTTELSGTESSSTTHAYSYTYVAGTYVDIVVHNVDYEYYRIDNFLLGSTSASVPIQQRFDRVYKT